MEDLKDKIKYCSECGFELTQTAKYCSNCGSHVLPLKNEETVCPKSNTLAKIFLNLIIFVCVIAVIILGIDLGFHFTENDHKLDEIVTKISNYLPFNTFKNTIITAENYEEITGQLSNNLTEEEACYCSYAMIYYVTQDGLSNLFSIAEDESLMYQRIYNKSIKQLINEGMSLMEENNITWEEYKSNLENLSN